MHLLSINMVFASLVKPLIRRQTIGKKILNVIYPFITTTSGSCQFTNRRKFKVPSNGIHSGSSLVETVSKMLIKPSSPTPQSLSRYNLSSWDQMMPSLYISVAVFYTDPNHEISKIRQQIQNSISRTLSSYYPFAGRLVENDHIRCNDEGVEFREVRIHCPILNIVKQSRSWAKDVVFPPEKFACNEGSLVVVQLSHFDCGGIAIAVSISHKVGDGSTLFKFVNDLATSARLSFHVPAPLLVSDSLCPRGDGLFSLPVVPLKNCVTRSFLFTAEEIEKLKLKAIESGIEQPTRVGVVTALLYQSADTATRSTNCGLCGSSVLIVPINLRPLMALPQNAVGNIISLLVCGNEDDRIEFPVFVGQLMKAKQGLKNLSQDKLSHESQFREVKDRLKHLGGKANIYYCSSLCRFPIHSVDFGWGKPISASLFRSPVKDLMMLMDSQGDGIEALVTDEEEKMSLFEKTKELLLFPSLDSPK